MDLFNNQPEETINLLPGDGIAHYYGSIFTQAKALHYMDSLLHNIEWKNDEAIIFGRHIITKRKVAWYGDAGFSYTYSNTTKQALPWTTALLELKGEAGAKRIMKENPDWVDIVNFPLGNIDIDTKEDYDRLINLDN